MRKITSFILIVLTSFTFFSFACSADENTNEYKTELNFFTGMFDWSDHKQASGLIGLQHQNDELFRKSFLGKLSPVTGGFLTENNAFYLYTGVQAEYQFGFLNITPSFTPGYYNYGNGKDLGYPLEFKSEIQISLDLNDNTNLFPDPDRKTLKLCLKSVLSDNQKLNGIVHCKSITNEAEFRIIRDKSLELVRFFITEAETKGK